MIKTAVNITIIVINRGNNCRFSPTGITWLKIFFLLDFSQKEDNKMMAIGRLSWINDSLNESSVTSFSYRYFFFELGAKKKFLSFTIHHRCLDKARSGRMQKGFGKHGQQKSWDGFPSVCPSSGRTSKLSTRSGPCYWRPAAEIIRLLSDDLFQKSEIKNEFLR